jgi:hypothetical protein
MGAQVGRLTTMMGLFGQLTQEYTLRKLRKRSRFNKFVVKHVLEGVLGMSPYTENSPKDTSPDDYNLDREVKVD